MKISEFRLSVCTFQTKKPHAIIFIRSQVLVYTNFADGQTDRQTGRRTNGHIFFQKAFFFLRDQEYIFMSIPISNICQISLPFDQSWCIFFSLLQIGMKTLKFLRIFIKNCLN